ncbi:hypothetical protein BDF19DRAFT_424097 [Syncephalis fuscata]|nr:hypothetical protein BDF19DRAFT_424097 [Syncephalis fuscata]
MTTPTTTTTTAAVTAIDDPNKPMSTNRNNNANNNDHKSSDSTVTTITNTHLSRPSSICYMGNALSSASIRRAVLGQTLDHNTNIVTTNSSTGTSATGSTASLPFINNGHNSDEQPIDEGHSRSGLFRRRTNAVPTTECSLAAALMPKRFEKKTDRLLRKKRLERATHASSTSCLHPPKPGRINIFSGIRMGKDDGAATAMLDDQDHESNEEVLTVTRSATWRRHSADATPAHSHTLSTSTTLLTAGALVTSKYPAGASRLEQMLPELFCCLAELLFADPVVLVRVSHLSRRMREQLSEAIWRRACRFWDARHLPTGWFSNWREFFVLFVPDHWGKRDFLKLHLSETGQQGFDYWRNGNILYCPDCKDKQLLSNDQAPHCMLCSSPTACAYVRLRVILFGSAAAAAAWGVTTTPTVTTFAEAVTNTNHTITTAQQQHNNSSFLIDHDPLVEDITTSFNDSLDMTTPSTTTTTANTVPLSVCTAPTPITTHEDNDQYQLTFWGQVWNDTVPCANGIRFLHGRPAFIKDQAIICGDCVRSLARLGHGRLEMAVRHQGTWALKSER